MHTPLSAEATTAVLGTAHGVTVTESTFAAGVRIDPHTHATGYLCVTLAGSVVDTLVQRRLDAEPGYSCWVPPETPHANHFGPRGARCLLLEIEGAALDGLKEVGCAESQPWGAYGGVAACRGFLLQGLLRAGVGTSLDIDELRGRGFSMLTSRRIGLPFLPVPSPWSCPSRLLVTTVDALPTPCARLWLGPRDCASLLRWIPQHHPRARCIFAG